MQRRTFFKRAGLMLGALPALGTVPASAALHTVPAAPLPAPGFDPLDWASVRDQFALRRDRIHMATFLLASHPKPVAEAIERHRSALDEDPSGYWHEHFMTIEGVQRAAAGRYLSANPDHIALTDSTTMGLGLIYSALRLEPGDEILSTTHDHYSTEMSLKHRAERTGATIRQIDLYEDPFKASVDEIVGRMQRAITDRTRVLAVTWVHSCTGVKLPLRAMADALYDINARRDAADRVLLCVDGVHGFGVEDVTVNDLGCDFFIAGTHKWIFGPRGTGIVWGRPEAWAAITPIVPSFGASYGVWLGLLPMEAVPVGEHLTPGGFHSFEHRWALKEAFDFHLQIGKARVQERIHTLNTQAKDALAAMPHVRLYTPMNPALSSGIICFDVEGYTPEEVVARLAAENIIASASPYRVSYPRLSPSLINNEAEVNQSVAAVAALA